MTIVLFFSKQYFDILFLLNFFFMHVNLQRLIFSLLHTFTSFHQPYIWNRFFSSVILSYSVIFHLSKFFFSMILVSKSIIFRVSFIFRYFFVNQNVPFFIINYFYITFPPKNELLLFLCVFPSTETSLLMAALLSPILIINVLILHFIPPSQYVPSLLKSPFDII